MQRYVFFSSQNGIGGKSIRRGPQLCITSGLHHCRSVRGSKVTQCVSLCLQSKCYSQLQNKLYTNTCIVMLNNTSCLNVHTLSQTNLLIVDISQGPGQCGVMSPCHWRGTRRRRCSSDPLHLDPGILLWERHKHPSSEQHDAFGRDSGWRETWRRAHGSPLCISHCKYHNCAFVTFKQDFSRKYCQLGLGFCMFIISHNIFMW